MKKNSETTPTISATNSTKGGAGGFCGINGVNSAPRARNFSGSEGAFKPTFVEGYLAEREAAANKIAELLFRFEAGEFEPDTRKHLAERFALRDEAGRRIDVDEAEARLLKACELLGVDGSQVEHYASQVPT